MKAKTKETPKSETAGAEARSNAGRARNEKTRERRPEEAERRLRTPPPCGATTARLGEWAGALPAELPGGGDATKRDETNFEVKRGGENACDKRKRERRTDSRANAPLKDGGPVCEASGPPA